MSTRVILAVTNDLSSDQRVQRTCRILTDMGADVLFVGRALPDSAPFEPEGYATRRFRLWFRRGALFYAAYQIRLLFFLLSRPFDIIVANDLDTLWPCALAAKWKSETLIYDSHEFFTGVPEIQHKPLVLGLWRWVERRYYHHAQAHITVNESIAKLLQQEYGGNMPVVVRNIGEMPTDIPNFSRAELDLPEDMFIAINQGAGINVERGMEETLEAISRLEGIMLLIVGSGDAIPELKKRVQQQGLDDRVCFVSRQPYRKLLAYTRVADIGLSLDKPTSINYTFSLPNKLFDYIQSGLPVLVSDVVEVRKIVEHYGIGRVVNSSDPGGIARGLVAMRNDGHAKYSKALGRAARDLHWDQERNVLASVFRPFLREQK